VLASKGDSKLAIPLRRIKVKRDKGGTITLITNDLERTAVEIAALYKGRWQIELLFRWIKQHLNLRKLIGNNRNAISLQVIAASDRLSAPAPREAFEFLENFSICALQNSSASDCSCEVPIAEIDKPPPVNPSKSEPKFLDRSAVVQICVIFPGQPCPLWGGIRSITPAG